MKYGEIINLIFIRRLCMRVYAMYGSKISSTLYLELISDLIIMSDGGHIH